MPERVRLILIIMLLSLVFVSLTMYAMPMLQSLHLF